MSECEWVNDNPRRFSQYQCGCGKKLIWKGDDANGYFICENDSHCGAIWDGKKYLGIDAHWNWCERCGQMWNDWDGESKCEGVEVTA